MICEGRSVSGGTSCCPRCNCSSGISERFTDVRSPALAKSRGSPWTWILYLDGRASDEQLAALEGVFTGRLGGDAERHFPWVWKASEAVAVRPVQIEVDHTRHRQRLRIRDHVSVRIRDRYVGEETVTCVIPGHDRAGEELEADERVVEDSPLDFNYRGVCGYGATFDYAGA